MVSTTTSYSTDSASAAKISLVTPTQTSKAQLQLFGKFPVAIDIRLVELFTVPNPVAIAANWTLSLLLLGSSIF